MNKNLLKFKNYIYVSDTKSKVRNPYPVDIDYASITINRIENRTKKYQEHGKKLTYKVARRKSITEEISLIRQDQGGTNVRIFKTISDILKKVSDLESEVRASAVLLSALLLRIRSSENLLKNILLEHPNLVNMLPPKESSHIINNLGNLSYSTLVKLLLVVIDNVEDPMCREVYSMLDSPIPLSKLMSELFTEKKEEKIEDNP